MKNINYVIEKINKSLMSDDEIKSVVQVLKSGFLACPEGGPVVRKFQSNMSSLLNQKHAFATTSGSSALHTAIASLEIKPKDEIMLPALSNIADCSAVLSERGKPVFIDIDPYDFNIDVNKIEEKITSNTKALIIVHMYGQPAKMDKIITIAKKHNLILIEDCAQAAGARYKGEYVGSFGDISCFSFYQTKHIVCGEGGMVLTRHEKLAEIIKSITNNGIKRENLDNYDYDRLGYNYQMTDIQAAIALEQLKKMDSLNRIRRKNADIYRDRLRDTEIDFQKVNQSTENVYFYLTGILSKKLLSKREEFLRRVKIEGVPIKKLYPLSLPEVTLLRDKVANDCSIAKDITKRLFNLYVNPGLDEKDIRHFAEVIRTVHKEISNL